MQRGGEGLRWLSINTQALFRTGETRPHAVVASFVDVTDRMAAEAAQRESEERFRTLVEHAPEAIVVLDPDTGRFVDVNENAMRVAKDMHGASSTGSMPAEHTTWRCAQIF